MGGSGTQSGLPLLFFGGAMSLYWVAGLAIYVAVEKLAPFGWRFSKLAGYGLIAVGVALGAAYGTGQLTQRVFRV